ncbi:hypothetical protein EUX98_g8853 [Antrodiella citrinella]|uniref:F-box domain-containing protein n=1 Tax=Antrodiella citrinella TaxID=2447956 RepID=A0A4S4M2C9_9APHY|nr:hypothetical protein EUX98_g8853 [Antrodiella citrinella]
MSTHPFKRSSLAPELRLDIALYLKEDYLSLKQLSCVSREWLDSARIPLFEKFTLFTNTKTLKKLLRFLRGTPHLARYIRTLSVDRRIEFEVERLPPKMRIEDLLTAVTLLPNLRELALLSCTVLDPRTDPVVDIGSAPPKPRPCKLTLSDSHIHQCAFAELFRSLTVIDFSATRLFVPGLEPIPTTFFLATQTINLGPWMGVASFKEVEHNRRQPLMANILDACPDTSTKVDVACNLRDVGEVDAMYRFLEKKGRHIENLRLDFSKTRKEFIKNNSPLRGSGPDGFGRMFRECDRMIQLSDCCPSLRTLEIYLPVSSETTWPFTLQERETDSFVVWRYALRMLASAPRTLTSIAIDVLVTFDVEQQIIDRSTIPLVDWEKWAQVLREFKDLKRLSFGWQHVMYVPMRYVRKEFDLLQSGREDDLCSHWMEAFRDYVTEKHLLHS